MMVIYLQCDIRNEILVKHFAKYNLVQNILISTGNQPLKGRYTVLKPSSGVSQRMTYAGLIDCHTFLRGVLNDLLPVTESVGKFQISFQCRQVVSPYGNDN